MNLKEYSTLRHGHVLRATHDLGRICSKGDIKVVIVKETNFPLIYYETDDGIMQHIYLALCASHFEVLFVIDLDNQ